MASAKKSCGISIWMPAPSPVLPSASTAPRCHTAFSAAMPACTTSRRFLPSRAAIRPTPQASCSCDGVVGVAQARGVGVPGGDEFGTGFFGIVSSCRSLRRDRDGRGLAADIVVRSRPRRRGRRGSPTPPGDAPRTMSPAANTPGSVVMKRAVVHLQRAPARHLQRRLAEHRRQVLGVEAQRLDHQIGRHGEMAALDRLHRTAGRTRRAGRDASAPRARRSRASSPRNASGADSQTNSTPSSSAFFTSRIEPGMLARSRR